MYRYLGIVIMVLITACSSTIVTPTLPITPSPMNASTVYVDVRSPEEFASGHVQNAINIPYDLIETRRHELDQYHDQLIILYCKSGRRAGIAEEILRNAGFTNIENAGGLEQLQAQGLSITSSK